MPQKIFIHRLFAHNNNNYYCHLRLAGQRWIECITGGCALSHPAKHTHSQPARHTHIVSVAFIVNAHPFKLLMKHCNLPLSSANNRTPSSLSKFSLDLAIFMCFCNFMQLLSFFLYLFLMLWCNLPSSRFGSALAQSPPSSSRFSHSRSFYFFLLFNAHRVQLKTQHN